MDILHFLQQIFAQLPFQSITSMGSFPYFIILVAVMIEGPFVILLAATLSSAGFLNPFFVFLAASAGNMIADTLWYYLGYFSKLKWISRLQAFYRGDPQKILHLSEIVRKNAVKILVVSKLTNVLVVPVLITTGLLKIPIRRWFPSLFIANCIVTAAFVKLGTLAASSILRVQSEFRLVAILISILFLFGISILIRRVIGRKLVENSLSTE